MLSAYEGPILSYGSRNPLGNDNTNPDRSPSVFWGGVGFLDHRAGYNVTKYGAVAIGQASAQLNQVPSAISAVNIVASYTPGAVLNLTLVSATGAGITVLSAPQTVWAAGSVIPTGTLAIDLQPALISFGTPQISSGYSKISFYDPTASIARNVRISSGGNDTGITFLVSGYDLYGFLQTEQITGVSGGVASGKKAFKFITSIVASGAPASTISVGTGDVYGFPMLSSFFGDVDIIWNNAFVTANTGYTAAVTTNPATSTTGDVRGTYAVQGAASNGTLRLMMFCQPSINNIALSSAGLWGVKPA